MACVFCISQPKNDDEIKELLDECNFPRNKQKSLKWIAATYKMFERGKLQECFLPDVRFKICEIHFTHHFRFIPHNISLKNLNIRSHNKSEPPSKKIKIIPPTPQQSNISLVENVQSNDERNSLPSAEEHKNAENSPGFAENSPVSSKSYGLCQYKVTPTKGSCNDTIPSAGQGKSATGVMKPTFSLFKILVSPTQETNKSVIAHSQQTQTEATQFKIPKINPPTLEIHKLKSGHGAEEFRKRLIIRQSERCKSLEAVKNCEGKVQGISKQQDNSTGGTSKLSAQEKIIQNADEITKCQSTEYYYDEIVAVPLESASSTSQTVPLILPQASQSHIEPSKSTAQAPLIIIDDTVNATSQTEFEYEARYNPTQKYFNRKYKPPCHVDPEPEISDPGQQQKYRVLVESDESIAICLLPEEDKPSAPVFKTECLNSREQLISVHSALQEKLKYLTSLTKKTESQDTLYKQLKVDVVSAQTALIQFAIKEIEEEAAFPETLTDISMDEIENLIKGTKNKKSQSIMSYQQDLIRQLKAESTSEINKVAAEKESLEEKVKKMESELLALRSQLESSKTNADQK